MGKMILTPATGTLDAHFAREFTPLIGAEYSLALAFLTELGYARIKRFPRFSAPTSRFVVGLGNYITSPSAIRALLSDGASVRLVPTTALGIFHPKLFLLSKDGVPQAFYVGSANGTNAAFIGNTELGYFTALSSDCLAAGSLFKSWYDALRPPTDSDIDAYARAYTRVNNKRIKRFDDVALLADLVLPTVDVEPSGNIAASRHIPQSRSLDANDARSAWVSLQSFTGEYTLQVEIPAPAAEVLTRLGLPERGRIRLRCEDNVIREMTYGYYGDNGMFRINIPNDVPHAEEVRRTRSGVLLITRAKGGLLLRIVVDAASIKAYLDRSIAYGSWGRTTKRSYGWF